MNKHLDLLKESHEILVKLHHGGQTVKSDSIDDLISRMGRAILQSESDGCDTCNQLEPEYNEALESLFHSVRTYWNSPPCDLPPIIVDKLAEAQTKRTKLLLHYGDE